MIILNAKTASEAKKLAKKYWPNGKFLKNSYKTLAEDVMVLTNIPSVSAINFRACPKRIVLLISERAITAIDVPRHFSKLLKFSNVNVVQNFFVTEYMLGKKNIATAITVRERVLDNGIKSFVIDYCPLADNVSFQDLLREGYELKIGTPKEDWGQGSWPINEEVFIAIKKIVESKSSGKNLKFEKPCLLKAV